MTFEIRQIDAWMNEEGDWYQNTSYKMSEVFLKDNNTKREFTKYLKNRYGITFKKNGILIEDDGDTLTIIDRKTKEPLFIAIPEY